VVDPWFVYVLRCGDGTLYCGVARDVAKRIAVHASGKGARYTRGRGPFEKLAMRKCLSQGDALRLENAVKRLPRVEKEALVNARAFRALQRTVTGLALPRSVGSAQQRKPVE